MSWRSIFFLSFFFLFSRSRIFFDVKWQFSIFPFELPFGKQRRRKLQDQKKVRQKSISDYMFECWIQNGFEKLLSFGLYFHVETCACFSYGPLTLKFFFLKYSDLSCICRLQPLIYFLCMKCRCRYDAAASFYDYGWVNFLILTFEVISISVERFKNWFLLLMLFKGLVLQVYRNYFPLWNVILEMDLLFLKSISILKFWPL